MAKQLKPAVAYLRTSSAANVGPDKDSDKHQRAAIGAYAKRAGFTIVDEHYDKAVSGADHIDERPGFREMLRRLAANGAKTIIVKSPSPSRVTRFPMSVSIGTRLRCWCRTKPRCRDRAEQTARTLDPKLPSNTLMLDRLREYRRLFETEITDGKHTAYGRDLLPKPRRSRHNVLRTPNLLTLFLITLQPRYSGERIGCATECQCSNSAPYSVTASRDHHFRLCQFLGGLGRCPNGEQRGFDAAG